MSQFDMLTGGHSENADLTQHSALALLSSSVKLSLVVVM